MTGLNLIPLLPELFMTLTGMGLLIVGVNRGNESTSVICWAVIYAMAIAGILLLGLDWQPEIVLNGMYKFDRFSGLMKLLILIGLIASLVLSVRFLEEEGIARFEYPVLVMFAGIGMMLMVSSHNMLGLYMGLELQSLSLYVLAAFHRNSIKSSEAGIKYFILGSLSSGMLLFGISLIYGFTGALDFGAIEATLMTLETVPAGVLFGLVFILAGLIFKVSGVPFHMWTPDVYQGAPTAVTALFAIAPKLAAIGLLVRLLFEPFAVLNQDWLQIIYFVSVGSMLVGAFAAIAQEDIKRLMAYSSIGHIGYALIGVVAGTQAGISAVIFYMLVYMAMTAGVFTILLSLRKEEIAYSNKISDLKGFSRTSPVLAYAMAILMFSMSGIPPMAGFFSKLFIFEAAVAQGYYILVVIGVLTTVVAAYYYLRIIKVMFFDEGGDPYNIDMPFARRAVLLISIVFILGFWIKPSIFIVTVQGAASALFSG